MGAGPIKTANHKLVCIHYMLDLGIFRAHSAFGRLTNFPKCMETRQNLCLKSHTCSLLPTHYIGSRVDALFTELSDKVKICFQAVR